MPPVGSALLPLTLMSVAVAAAPLPATTRRGAHVRAESKPPFLVTAHHDFKPTDTNQLPFGKGDVLEIIRVDAATGWAAARRPSTTTVGWIPRSFVIAADDAKPKPTAESLPPRQKSNETSTNVRSVIPRHHDSVLNRNVACFHGEATCQQATCSFQSSSSYAQCIT